MRLIRSEDILNRMGIKDAVCPFVEAVRFGARVQNVLVHTLFAVAYYLAMPWTEQTPQLKH